MINSFKIEFERCAGIVGAGYETKNILELQDFVQRYNFDQPLINWVPIESVDSEVGASHQLIYSGNCVLQFLVKASKNDNFEDVKDSLIDETMLLHEKFIAELNKNTNLVFINALWRPRIKVLRQYTSNFLCGVESSIAFNTACNRLL